jgi:hypothetical protein
MSDAVRADLRLSTAKTKRPKSEEFAMDTQYQYRRKATSCALMLTHHKFRLSKRSSLQSSLPQMAGMSASKSYGTQ